MNDTPRLRMVAGPNGSGKSTLLRSLAEKFHLYHCLNPDLLEADLLKNRKVNFGGWGLSIDELSLRTFIENHALGSLKMLRGVKVRANVLSVGKQFTAGYFISILGDFMRRQWLAQRASFTFETVMSSRDKVEFLREAQNAGYRTYLYYICTESPLINRERVAVRVSQGGHSVAEDKITQRYARSLGLLRDAISASNRAYLFDNSSKALRLIAEFENATLVRATNHLPAWFVRHALKQ